MKKLLASDASKIAVVGISCRYPDADDAQALLTNTLAQRRSFRAIPDQRLSSDYYDASGRHPDKSYVRQAAVLKNFEFDRAKYKIPLSSYDNSDMTHWLALTVAAEAIQDIRFVNKSVKLDHNAVRVVVGNTLAGEFSRSHIMRLRWPYVKSVLAAQLQASELGLSEDVLRQFMNDFERRYKQPFPVPSEDFLAGGLANTIAGRICNHFDFRGGGYTVDGACASSLLAVTDACNALTQFDADVVLAGGVDLSIDPFELVGFSRTLALAKREMRVFDENSQGFWPGEGCGFVALMRYQDAVEHCDRIYGVINGWGVSSDGHGGLTRPEVEGQKLALKRSYERAGYGIETVTYFEGHGTGTKIGDAAELTALISAREQTNRPIRQAVISSIKANIGHTKAASGLAGLIRALKCLEQQVLPPTTGCFNPHALFSQYPGNLTPADRPMAWTPQGAPRRAGVSAMGFGGINTHITLEAYQGHAADRPSVKQDMPWARLGNVQREELFLFSYASARDLAWTVDYVAQFAGQCSLAELGDLAAELAYRSTLGALSLWRAAVVASTPQALAEKLRQLSRLLETFEGGLYVDTEAQFAVSGGVKQAKISLLFPGQGAPVRSHGGGMAQRFEAVRTVFAAPQLAKAPVTANTDYAQIAITTASLAGQQTLQRLGIEADMAIGHSLGELSALHWAGGVSESDLLNTVAARGAAMVSAAVETAGAMAAVGRDSAWVGRYIETMPDVFVANINAERQTVVSGTATAIDALIERLTAAAVSVTRLNVNQAFHSPFMAKSADLFKAALQQTDFTAPRKPLISTVTGAAIGDAVDWVDYLQRQITSPVLFQSAIAVAARDTDLFIEVGPGSILSNLVGAQSDKPALSMDVGSDSLAPLLSVVGAAFVAGRAAPAKTLFSDRYFKRFAWGVKARYLANPCERNDPSSPIWADADADMDSASPTELSDDAAADESILESLRAAIAQQVGLPKWTVQNDSRMLSDLHLNSISVSKIVSDVAHAFGLPPSVDPAQFSNSSLDEINLALENLVRLKASGETHKQALVHGVRSWVRYFTTEHRAAPALTPGVAAQPGDWTIFPATASLSDSEQMLLSAPGKGALLILSDDLGDQYPNRLLEAAQWCLQQRQSEPSVQLVVIQTAPVGGGFLKSFSLENPKLKVALFTVQTSLNAAMAESIVGRLHAIESGFSEFSVLENGAQAVPVWRPIASPTAAPAAPVDDNDLVLITGGGKGISAECGYQLALSTGCALLIIGRSGISADEELARNVERLHQAKIRATYFRANVDDKATIRSAIANALDNWGMTHVAGIVHGAGINHPSLVETLTRRTLRDTVSPKVYGLRNLIDCVEPERLKLLVTFSSIIGRMGLHGEAHYALANERLSLATEAFQKQYPHVVCRALEWSIWAGVGMGHNMGQIDTLIEQGISPITIDDGIKAFMQLISSRDYPTAVVVTSRFSRSELLALPDIDASASALRFIDTVEVLYPGIELVAQCRLSVEQDRYLDDHTLDGARIFPAALVLEAFAQAAVALLGPDALDKQCVFSDVKFAKAIIVPDARQGLRLRIAVLVEADGAVSCVARCSDTDFHVNHVEATCRLVDQDRSRSDAAVAPFIRDKADMLPDFDVAQALYKNILFQKGLFKRVAGYWHVEASGCSAQLAPAQGAAAWFHPAMETRFVLGDPGVRDAALHAVQACMPHRTLIPVSVARVESAGLSAGDRYQLDATEIVDKGEELVFDLAVADEQGQVVERWRQVVFRKTGVAQRPRFEAPVLLAPFLERHIKPLIPGIELIVQMTPGQRSAGGASAAPRRPDGKPSPLPGERFESNAYSQGWRLSASAGLPVACDLEWFADPQARRWRELLGERNAALAATVAELTAEDAARSAARVWTVYEAIKKLGIAAHAPITVAPSSDAHCVVFKASGAVVYSVVAEPDDKAVVAAAMAVESG